MRKATVSVRELQQNLKKVNRAEFRRRFQAGVP
jgi:hypothetical protein